MVLSSPHCINLVHVRVYVHHFMKTLHTYHVTWLPTCALHSHMLYVHHSGPPVCVWAPCCYSCALRPRSCTHVCSCCLHCSGNPNLARLVLKEPSHHRPGYPLVCSSWIVGGAKELPETLFDGFKIVSGAQTDWATRGSEIPVPLTHR